MWGHYMSKCINLELVLNLLCDFAIGTNNNSKLMLVLKVVLIKIQNIWKNVSKIANNKTTKFAYRIEELIFIFTER